LFMRKNNSITCNANKTLNRFTQPHKISVTN
jgi:hypothetical protein